AGDEVEHRRRRDRTQHLRHDVRQEAARRETSAGPEADGDRGVEVAAGDMSDREGHGEHGQAKGERHSHEADAEILECRGDHRAAAAAKYEPERADEFRTERFCHVRTPDDWTLPPRPVVTIRASAAPSPCEWKCAWPDRSALVAPAAHAGRSSRR